MAPPDRSHPTQYLDGLRGCAAVVVFVHHYSRAYLRNQMEHGYGFGNHQSTMQFPILRLIYSGFPMVAIFFVVSGYVISYKPVRDPQGGRLLVTVGSPAFRRGIRLFVPPIVSTFLVMLAVQCNLYDTAGHPGLQRFDSFGGQFHYWSQFVRLELLSLWSWDDSISYRYDPNLWTITPEFQRSMLLLLSHLLLARNTQYSIIRPMRYDLSSWCRWFIMTMLFDRNIKMPEVRHLMDLQFPPSQHLSSQKSTNMTKTLSLGRQQVPVPGFGAMGLNSAMGTDLNLEQSEPVLLKAVELGCTFWDTAVAYKSGENEKLLGDFIKKHNVRDKVFGEQVVFYLSLQCIISSCPAVASKCGFEVFGPGQKVTNSAAHIKEYIEGTIDRLGFTPDLYYLHLLSPQNRPQYVTSNEKYLFRIECSAETLRKANATKIDVVQAEYSVFKILHETTGLIDTAKKLDVAFVELSPLGHGWLVDDFPSRLLMTSPPMTSHALVRFPKFQGENFYKNKAIVDEIKKLATKKGCSIAQIALAWVAAQGLITIPGTTKASRLEENWTSRDVELTEEELREIQVIVEAAKPVGERFSAIS
ncbi:hypothetical protein VN97_g11740 [Penicillium thymicola]|uniref:Uncharacterized protein n=1 Tax=Penicillium thymicola TaxID=293382 RepID=A0AAI9T6S4_PENTH|nr:hypothetical protein VN97_g11740 [Penicillium thymicola]